MKPIPITEKEVEELLWAIKQTQVTENVRAAINNLYRKYINPTAERCASLKCGRLKKYQDELHRFYSLNNHKWKPIQDIKEEITNDMIDLKDAVDQVSSLKFTKTDVQSLLDVKVIYYVVNDDKVYINGRKLASLEIVNNRLIKL